MIACIGSYGGFRCGPAVAVMVSTLPDGSVRELPTCRRCLDVLSEVFVPPGASFVIEYDGARLATMEARQNARGASPS